jgi:hypothetical protein
MVVLNIGVGFLKLGNILPELMLNEELAFQQQFDGIVQGSPADPVVFILHGNIKGFHIKVAFPGIYLIHYGKSFGRFPVTMGLQILDEDILYRFPCFLTIHN